MFGGGGMGSLEKQMFNLKMAAKQLNRESHKCEKAERAEKAKLKKAIEKGNREGAKIHAQNAIRQKNQALNFLRMGSRIDAVATRVQTALTMQKVSKSMASVVKSMGAALKSMNLEKVSTIMDTFEKQFEDLDVQSQYMENSMGNSTTLSTPEDQVEGLMQQVADEHGLEMSMDLGPGEAGKLSTGMTEESNDLTDRLAKLRQS